MNLLRRSPCMLSHLLQGVYCSANFRSFTKIAALLDLKPFGNRMTIQGWVKSKRKMKNLTFIDVSDGSSPGKLQVALPKNTFSATAIDVGSSVKVNGTLRAVPGSEQIELLADDVEIIGPCNLEDGYPFAPRKTYAMDYIRQYLHLRPRTNLFNSMLRIRSRAAREFRNNLADQGFFEVTTPVLTSHDCEGAGEVFTVKPQNKDLLRQMSREGLQEDEFFFNTKAFLTVSGQMHLECAVRGLSHVFTLGPSFRAENSNSRLHLSEFHMLEAEEVLTDSNVENLLLTIETMLRNVTQNLLTACSDEFNVIRDIQLQQKVDTLDPEKIQETFLSTTPYTVLTYKEAMTILSNSKESFKAKLSFQEGMAKEHELYLVKYNSGKPVFVIDWPAHLKPFYMKESKTTSTVEALDLLVPVVGELCGGSVREDNVEVLTSKLKMLGLESDLSWYLDLRRFGNIVSGGFGMGFERYLQCLLNVPNIKDVIPFPRAPHNCKL